MPIHFCTESPCPICCRRALEGYEPVKVSPDPTYITAADSPPRALAGPSGPELAYVEKRELTRLRQMELRMGKIAEFHGKYVDSHGGTYGDCNECGRSWPCPTYVWATTERDTVLYCWDPAEDEDVET